MLINPLYDLVEPFPSGLESTVEEDLKPPRPTEDEELGEVFQATSAPIYDDSESTYDPSEFGESFSKISRFDDKGIELPPLPGSPASDEQDQEEEHSEELTQQEAPPETQTTTEVQHDIPQPVLEPQPVPPPVPQPEPEHEPQPGDKTELSPAFCSIESGTTFSNVGSDLSSL
ncbi:procyclic form-specific polypeptide B-alpha-like [Arachis ipaensis]|uniref:procyclic form-specific polypeptide B-alpha-like n=1 Tax=Arachis ipaensis TaxID=130454 RepID=UPI000A2B406A|nr:procyclic form-specific polypeptide B-alpha-like [Arachis ipaensis]